MTKKQFVVIGLGRFGSSIARTIYNLGHDVLAIDVEEAVVQEISQEVTHAVQLDATNEEALKTLGIRNFDVAIVTIGENVQSSILATLIVKELGVKYVVAKAHSELHAKTLYKIGANRVVLPEKEMGIRVAHNLASTNILDFIELSPDYSIVELTTLPEWHHKTLKEINIRANYGINIMAIKKDNTVNISPTANEMIEPGDILVAIGDTKGLSKLDAKIL